MGTKCKFAEEMFRKGLEQKLLFEDMFNSAGQLLLTMAHLAELDPKEL